MISVGIKMDESYSQLYKRGTMYDLQVNLNRNWVSAWFSFHNPLKTMLVISYPEVGPLPD